MTVSPRSELGNTPTRFTFTFTAGTQPLNDGVVALGVPSLWCDPTPTNTTVSTGTLTFKGQTLDVTGVTLSDGQTMTIRYTVTTPDPSAKTTYTFAVQMARTASGTLTDVTPAPTVLISHNTSEPTTTYC